MRQSNLLIKALAANAAFSGFSAITLILFSGWIASQLGLPDTTPVVITGVALALFALQLAAIAKSRRVKTWEILSIIVGDLIWVVASVVLGIIYIDQLTTIGQVLVFGVALVVLVFAECQGIGLKRWRAA